MQIFQNFMDKISLLPRKQKQSQKKFGRFVQFHYILIRNFSYLTNEMEQSYLNITLDGYIASIKKTREITRCKVRNQEIFFIFQNSARWCCKVFSRKFKYFLLKIQIFERIFH